MVSRVTGFFQGRVLVRQLEDELQFHIEQEIQANLRRGLCPEEARRQALIALGGIEKTKEEFRDALGLRLLDDLIRDLQYGLRQLRRSPGFSVVAVLTLALGIGANAAIFSVIQAVLLRPLPFPEPDRLMILYGFTLDTSNFEEWRKQARSYGQFAALSPGAATLNGVEEPERLRTGEVSADFFPLLGIQPALGRFFISEDYRGGRPAVVASDRFWRRKLGALESALGSTLILDQKGYILIGVAPPQVGPLPYPDIELWLPLVPGRAHLTTALARLKSGVAVESAQAEAQTVAARFAEDGRTRLGRSLIRAMPLKDFLVGDTRMMLLVLAGAVGFVLLIACSNVANLLLIRTSVRAREIAMRTALGAGRGRLVRQLLTESLLLALAGSALGLLVGRWSRDLLVHLLPYRIPRIDEAVIDGGVLVFTLALAVAASLGLGLTPALQAVRCGMQEMLKEGARGVMGGRGARRVRSVLVVVQVSVALMLLIGAGLLTKTFLLLRPTHPGFEPANRLTLSMRLPSARYPNASDKARFADEAINRLSSVPGVQDAAVVSNLPLSGLVWVPDVQIDGRIVAGYGRDLVVHCRVVSQGFFRVMGIPLVSGRGFGPLDEDPARSGVAVVNEILARRLWPDSNPLGRRLSLPSEEGGRDLTVVGVARGTRIFVNSTAPRAELYLPFANAASSASSLVVHTSDDPRRAIAVVKDVLRTVEPDLVISSVQTMEDLLDTSIAEQRFHAVLLGALAGLAFVLALVGIYCVIAYSIRLRTQEMGVRLALGATPSDLLFLVIRQGFWLAFAGIVSGGAGALALTRYLQSMLYEVRPTDPATFVAVTAAWLAIALAACYLPARRAARTDPIQALRYE
jgi:putative ABC transport system permease protein